jgi:hypothetical protein
VERLVKAEEGLAELQRRAEKLRRAHEHSPEILERAAREVAAGVKGMAQRAGHNVAIRVVTRGDGVRLTVVGPQAVRYRRLVEEELKRRVPDVKAEIRTQITRRSR